MVCQEVGLCFSFEGIMYTAVMIHMSEIGHRDRNTVFYHMVTHVTPFSKIECSVTLFPDIDTHCCDMDMCFCFDFT